MRLIVGISGASGSIYGIRLLEALKERKIETHLIISSTSEEKSVHHFSTGKVPHRLMRLLGISKRSRILAIKKTSW